MRQTLHETLMFRAPAGFKAAVAEIAAREHLTPPCYLRQLALKDVGGCRALPASAGAGRKSSCKRRRSRPQ